MSARMMPASFSPKLSLAALAFAVALPALQGCVPAIIVGGAAAGVMSVHDRRTAGTQTDDETSEWKASQRLPERVQNFSHINFTAYNRRILITGEVPSDEARATVEAETRRLDGVRDVINELTIGQVSSLGSRTGDSVITSKIKARLVDNNQISANHIKVVTERGTAYLMGIVNEREAKVAIQIARTTEGVRKVVNVMEIISENDTRRLDTQALGGPTPQRPAPVENR